MEYDQKFSVTSHFLGSLCTNENLFENAQIKIKINWSERFFKKKEFYMICFQPFWVHYISSVDFLNEIESACYCFKQLNDVFENKWLIYNAGLCTVKHGLLCKSE